MANILHIVDLSVQEGERIAIIGASGCGKSVFLRCLNLLERPDAGSVAIGGREITAQGAKVDEILQGGIRSFAEKYGIGGSRVYGLQYCAEELIYEFFDSSFADMDAVQMELALTYAQTKDIICLELKSDGVVYDPFSADEDDEEHIGITILKKKVKHFSYGLEEGVNWVRLEL